MTKVFFAKEATCKIDAAASVSLSNSTVLDTAFSSATTVTGQMKNVSIKPSPGDASVINLLGTSSSFQNQEMNEDPPELVEISANIVLPGDEIMELEIFGSGTAAGGTHTTYRIGQATRTKLAVLVNVDDGTDEVNHAGTNMVLTAHDLSLNGDGHFEGNVTFKCLAMDFYGPQFKN